ncbi:MAG: hypothetical protein MUD00_00510 [Candidatus Pacebacteria bacterium]|jgi:hypothetical protein|nr:hypothetical protein [Candidatus Paceibacterota bacterium]
MVFRLEKSGISETIISLLAHGATNTKELQIKVNARKKVTKQAFYKALRELIAREIVLKNKQVILLNNSWVNKLHDFINTIDEHYQSQTASFFFNLSEGESLVYRFKSIPNLDALWMHYFYLIVKQEKEASILMHNQHEFWSLVRPEEQEEMYQWIKNNKRRAYIVIGNNTKLDKATTKHIQDYDIEMMYEEGSSFKETYYYAIISDYIMTTVIDQKTARAVDAIYKKYEVVNKSVMSEVENILKQVKKSKVIIQKNKVRADKIRKMLIKKYFTF